MLIPIVVSCNLATLIAMLRGGEGGDWRVWMGEISRRGYVWIAFLEVVPEAGTGRIFSKQENVVMCPSSVRRNGRRRRVYVVL